MIDLDAAMTNPSGQYADPEALLADDQLTRDQKVRALRAWELEARQLAVADGERMQADSANGAAQLLQRVHSALRAQGADPAEAPQAPTVAGALAE